MTPACRRSSVMTLAMVRLWACGASAHSRWHKQGIRTMSDVKERDSEHKKKKERDAAPVTRDPSNRFNNFNQRPYDYSKLEQQLLKRP